MKLSNMSFALIVKRLLIFGLIIACFGYFLNIFATNEIRIRSFKPYYLESYYHVADYEVSNLSSKVVAETQATSAANIPVLVYHGILEKPDSVSTSLSQFSSEMFSLKKAGYQTVKLDDFRDYIAGKKKLPAKSFLLTFDDGRKDSYYPVDPILKQLDYTAVMFVISGTLQKPNNFHLTKAEIREMLASGRWEVGAHGFLGHSPIIIDSKGTKGHFYSNKKWIVEKNRLETDEEFRVRIVNDLQTVRDQLHTYFGVASYSFAFPFNDYARESVNYPGAETVFQKEVNRIYPMLFYQIDTNHASAGNLFASRSQYIKRVDVDPAWDSKSLISNISK